MSPLNPIRTSSSKGGRIGYVGIIAERDGVIQGIVTNSSAERAGLKKNDKIVAVNGHSVSLNDLQKSLRGLMGTRVVLRVSRRDKQYLCTIERDQSVHDFRNRMKNLAQAEFGTVSSASRDRAGLGKPIRMSVKGLSESDLAMISIWRRTRDTELVRVRVLESLSLIPPAVRNSLVKLGLKIVITPTMLEAYPQYANIKMSGYKHGGGFLSTGGIFDKELTTVFISERFAMGNRATQLNEWTEETVLHEIGHAVDLMWKISNTESFNSAYELDSSKLRNSDLDNFSYILQDGLAGKREMFAELFVFIFSPPERRTRAVIDIGTNFPNCLAEVKKSLEKDHEYAIAPDFK